ncbi:hypothetical protein [Planotetraspora phitsanulokensis]|uniref:hypothetical protein n=1 Tax=Planotetraspora phitsanulokensis TaxID=575192 RepID=UPI0019527C51|nr:hypothetical protein [Planotetraspora phitsanulokensis]
MSRYAEAKALLADPRLSKDGARALELFPEGTADALASSLSAHMLTSDPPDHTRLRTLVNKAFTARTVARLRPRQVPSLVVAVRRRRVGSRDACRA